jgi:hypothetical protein
LAQPINFLTGETLRAASRTLLDFLLNLAAYNHQEYNIMALFNIMQVCVLLFICCGCIAIRVAGECENETSLRYCQNETSVTNQFIGKSMLHGPKCSGIACSERIGHASTQKLANRLSDALGL